MSDDNIRAEYVRILQDRIADAQYWALRYVNEPDTYIIADIAPAGAYHEMRSDGVRISLSGVNPWVSSSIVLADSVARQLQSKYDTARTGVLLRVLPIAEWAKLRVDALTRMILEIESA